MKYAICNREWTSADDDERPKLIKLLSIDFLIVIVVKY